MPKITLNFEDIILQALKLKASLHKDLEDIKSWEDRKGEDTNIYKEFLELPKKR